MLDTMRPVATPEGIELRLRLAGPLPRAVAWAVDTLLRFMVLGVALTVLIPLGGLGLGLGFILWFTLEWLAPAMFEVLWGGATPGKKIMGLAVVRDDGAPVDWGAALTRNLLRTVDFLPVLYGVGLASMLVSRDFQRLGDIVAATVVIHREPAYRPAAIPPAPPRPPRVPLSLAEQRAVLDFAERVPALTPQRAQELAEIPAHLTDAASGEAATQRLLQIANFVMGRAPR